MRFASPLLVLVLAACSGGADSELDNESVAVLAAALQSQSDVPTDLEARFEEEPDQRHWSHHLFDLRLCVAREVAGDASDFDRNVYAIGQLASGDSISGRVSAAPGTGRERWDEVEHRSRMPADVLPDHLRWDHPLSYCPSGVLHLSHPQIEGDRARIFLDNSCSGWCGWGGMLELHKIDGEWQARDLQVHWVA